MRRLRCSRCATPGSPSLISARFRPALGLAAHFFDFCFLSFWPPKTPLERRGSSCSAGCTKNQPRRSILRPFRGLAAHWHSRLARKPSKSRPGGPDSSPPDPGKPSFSLRGADDYVRPYDGYIRPKSKIMVFGRFWTGGPVLGRFGQVLGRFWPMLGRFWPMLGRFRPGVEDI